ncbi:MAG: ribulose-phosphate 3-epimerase [Bacteroidia bacterium]|nr:ribulose-phosphate 3-epimerase [Bacteroidia bacterium]
MPILTAPSLLAADFNRLGETLDWLHEAGADWVHCDVMDGHFVPNISFGLPVIKALKSRTRLPLDVHLMITDPDRYITDFRDAGADILTVHAEACLHLDRTLHAIRKAGMQAGVALNPATPISVLEHILPLADLVLLMTVNPGFGSQPYIPYVEDKCRALAAEIRRRGLSTLIEVDGGITPETGARIVAAGAQVLVAGSSIFQAANPAEVLQQLKHLQ